MLASGVHNTGQQWGTALTGAERPQVGASPDRTWRAISGSAS